MLQWQVSVATYLEGHSTVINFQKDVDPLPLPLPTSFLTRRDGVGKFREHWHCLQQGVRANGSRPQTPRAGGALCSARHPGKLTGSRWKPFQTSPSSSPTAGRRAGHCAPPAAGGDAGWAGGRRKPCPPLPGRPPPPHSAGRAGGTSPLADPGHEPPARR